MRALGCACGTLAALVLAVVADDGDVAVPASGGAVVPGAEDTEDFFEQMEREQEEQARTAHSTFAGRPASGDAAAPKSHSDFDTILPKAHVHLRHAASWLVSDREASREEPSGITEYGAAGAQEEDMDYDDGMFGYHKELWPLNGMDVFCLVFSAVALVIAAGGGIGGGGILVPMYMIFLKFKPKHAIALSNFTILGGAITNTFFNVQEPGSPAAGGAAIDWNIVVMMEPSTLAGAVVGSFLSKCLPDAVLALALTLVLALFSWRTLEKGVRMFQKESEDERMKVPGEPDIDEETHSDEEPSESQALVGQRGEVLVVEEEPTPWLKIALLIICFAGCVVITILKGSGHGSVIGVSCGSFSFWALSFLTIPWVGLFGLLFRHMIIAETLHKTQMGHKFADTEIRWTARTTVRYPLICILAGVVAGLFGVGGGVVKGPLMLEMGVSPRVAVASAATMILFTTAAACVSFQVFGLLEPRYGLLCFLLGLLCTAVGQGAVNAWMRAAKRQSPPVLSIGLVMALSTLLVALEAFEKLTRQDFADLIEPSEICSIAD